MSKQVRKAVVTQEHLEARLKYHYGIDIGKLSGRNNVLLVELLDTDKADDAFRLKALHAEDTNSWYNLFTDLIVAGVDVLSDDGKGIMMAIQSGILSLDKIEGIVDVLDLNFLSNQQILDKLAIWTRSSMAC